MSNKINTLLERAAQFYRQRNLTAALETYQHLLAEKPNAVEVLHPIAVIQAQLNQLDSAFETIQQALKVDANNEQLYNSKGNILALQNKLLDAVNCYHQAIKLNPNYAVAYSSLGKCLYQQQKFTTAKKALEKALQLQSSLIEAKYNLALVLIAEQDLQTAISHLEAVILVRPNFAQAIGQLGECYLVLGQYEQALKQLDKRAELEPKHIEANHSLAQALALTGDFEAAAQYYEKTLMLDAHHVEANQNLANALLKLKDASKALNYYFHQISIKPTPESYYNIGVILMQQERGKDSEQYFLESQKMDPDFLPTYLNLGAIALKQQRYQDAIDYYRQGLTIDPGNPELEYIINALSNENAPDRAPDAYLQSLFDQYAQYYDQHLTQCLDYRVPQHMLKLVESTLNPAEQSLSIVDLGCGTGLVGSLFKPLASLLTGVDISEKMIAIAQHKNLYNQLIQADIETGLQEFKDVDLIIAADVFSYVGDLTRILSKCHAALKPGGYLLFSVEKTLTEPYILQKNMRYAHSKAHIEALADFVEFEILECENVALRTQQKKPVDGYVYLLRNITSLLSDTTIHVQN